MNLNPVIQKTQICEGFFFHHCTLISFTVFEVKTETIYHISLHMSCLLSLHNDLWVDMVMTRSRCAADLTHAIILLRPAGLHTNVHLLRWCRLNGRAVRLQRVLSLSLSLSPRSRYHQKPEKVPYQTWIHAHREKLWFEDCGKHMDELEHQVYAMLPILNMYLSVGNTCPSFSHIPPSLTLVSFSSEKSS